MSVAVCVIAYILFTAVTDFLHFLFIFTLLCCFGCNIKLTCSLTCTLANLPTDLLTDSLTNQPTNQPTNRPNSSQISQLFIPSGHYMYIEASSPRRPGNKAQLVSSSQPASAGACLSFWYHMYGRTMGQFHVYLQQGGQITNTLFNMSGNQGNRWIRSDLTVRSPGSTWQVRGGYLEDSCFSVMCLMQICI